MVDQIYLSVGLLFAKSTKKCGAQIARNRETGKISSHWSWWKEYDYFIIMF